MGWIWDRDGEQIRSIWINFRLLFPFLAVVVVIASKFVDSRLWEAGALGLGVVASVLMTADLARSFLDRDRNNAFMRGKNTPVTPLQIVFTVALTLVYTFMILIVMERLIGFALWPDHLTTALCAVIAAFLFSFATAWQNVRLWWGQAAEYEENLKELEEEDRHRKSRLSLRQARDV